MVQSVSSKKPNPREQDMTSLSPVNAERLKLAFQECRDMEGTLNEQLEAYAAAGREIFPAYGEAVHPLVARIHENRGRENAPPPRAPIPPLIPPAAHGPLDHSDIPLGTRAVAAVLYCC